VNGLDHEADGPGLLTLARDAGGWPIAENTSRFNDTGASRIRNTTLAAGAQAKTAADEQPTAWATSASVAGRWPVRERTPRLLTSTEVKRILSALQVKVNALDQHWRPRGGEHPDTSRSNSAARWQGYNLKLTALRSLDTLLNVVYCRPAVRRPRHTRSNRALASINTTRQFAHLQRQAGSTRGRRVWDGRPAGICSGPISDEGCGSPARCRGSRRSGTNRGGVKRPDDHSRCGFHSGGTLPRGGGVVDFEEILIVKPNGERPHRHDAATPLRGSARGRW